SRCLWRYSSCAWASSSLPSKSAEMPSLAGGISICVSRTLRCCLREVLMAMMGEKMVISRPSYPQKL
ncbi:hypothetical protein N9875_01140, partial [bacterium]|nr:hypothetical protein [bacterium]